MSEKVVEMAALKMPIETMDFLRRNPKLARKTGKLMVMLFDMKETIKNLESLFTRSSLFQEHIEDGTPEELEVFLKACITAQNTEGHVLHVGNLPEEAFEEIRTKLGDHILSTDVNPSEKEEKEVPKVNLFQRKNN